MTPGATIHAAGASVCGDCRRWWPRPIRARAIRTGGAHRAVRRYLPLVQLATNADRLVVQAIVGLKVPDFPNGTINSGPGAFIAAPCLMPEIYRLASFSSMSRVPRARLHWHENRRRRPAMMNRRQMMAAAAAASAAWPLAHMATSRRATGGQRIHRVGLSGGRNGRPAVAPAEREAARQLRSQRPGRPPRGRRRTPRRGICQARQPGRADHPANPRLDHDALSAHVQDR